MKTLKLNYKRTSRITNAHEYSRVLSNAHRFDLPYLVICAYPNKCGRARLGTIIAKRKLGNSVLCNRLRRIIKESFRNNQLHIPSVDIIIIAKTTIATAKNSNFTVVPQILRMGWKKLAAVFAC